MGVGTRVFLELPFVIGSGESDGPGYYNENTRCPAPPLSASSSWLNMSIPSEIPRHGSKYRGSALRILCAEDNDMNRRIFSRVIRHVLREPELTFQFDGLKCLQEVERACRSHEFYDIIFMMSVSDFITFLFMRYFIYFSSPVM